VYCILRNQRERTTHIKEIFPCIILISIGLADWLTTIVGITNFGATETNLLLSTLTQSNLLAFSIIKLSATLLIGALFYKGSKIETPGANYQLGKRFLQSGYFLSLTMLTVVVTNNVIMVVRVL
jgi:hypothetical protein